ncbi:stage III sporulation protein AE [Hathewaya limosa]|uniref:Stage III sporulation protein AE n=1 Tax=Hathewaya limosa TaxID=1536 RepID=A0ABU0JRT4_HATLI|nr:stage III sporulation protein AE [Hathewaya limosa]MDQ0479807.1 stage III sporulation protein AE [Hathewaya limosa]
MKNIEKIKKVILIVFLSIIIFMPQGIAKAENYDMQVNNIAKEQTKKEYTKEYKEVDDLYEYIRNLKSDYEILRDIEPKEFVDNFVKGGDSKFKKQDVLKWAKKYIFKEIGSTMKLMSVLIIIALICSLLKQLEDAFSNNNISSIAYFTCFATMVIVIAKSFYVGIDLARSSIEGISNFMYAIIPVLMMLLGGLGNASQVMFMDPIIIASINIGGTIISKIVLPLIILSFVLNFVNNLSKDYKVNNLSSLIKNSVMWLQGGVLTIFVTLLTIRSMTASTMDEITVKTAKFAVDTFVPIVGSSLSDAISTVAGYGILLKNGVGTLGMVILILIMIAPIVKLFCMAALYKITGAIVQPISDEKLVNCINSTGNCLILVMASLICITVMNFIMIAILTATGKGIIA